MKFDYLQQEECLIRRQKSMRANTSIVSVTITNEYKTETAFIPPPTLREPKLCIIHHPNGFLASIISSLLYSLTNLPLINTELPKGRFLNLITSVLKSELIGDIEWLFHSLSSSSSNCMSLFDDFLKLVPFPFGISNSFF